MICYSGIKTCLEAIGNKAPEPDVVDDHTVAKPASLNTN